VNQSLMKGVFPESWKTSIVKPLPKVTKPKTLKDLRPISILPAMSKIVEKIAVGQMVDYVNQKDILPKLQSGGRKNHSTCTALVNLFSDLYDAKDNGRCSTVGVLDYSQAYDSINPTLLTAKMKYYKFSEKSIRWVESYFSGRRQFTKVGNEISSALIKLFGAPQGSGGGSFYFDLYMADLPNCLEYCTMHQYIDDCQVHIYYERGQVVVAITYINADLNNIMKWSVSNGLKLNISKCSVLHIAPEEVIQNLNDAGVWVALDGQALAVCDKIKTLGVILDKDLSFSDHVTATTSDL